MSSGAPDAVTRVAPTSQRVVRHGCGLEGATVNGHPATFPWSVRTAAGVPDTITRVLAAMIDSGAPCGHRQFAPECSTGPGMASPFSSSAGLR